MMSLWAIIRSPLIMGGDLPRCDAFTLSLLTNPEVIAVDQHSFRLTHRPGFSPFADPVGEGQDGYWSIILRWMVQCWVSVHSLQLGP